MKCYFAAAFVFRIAFVWYGTYHDALMEVKYTDVDYTVFTDAAQHIVNGDSPYLTETYKYTPLLAYILTPNIYFHVLYGKLLFCFMDLLVALIMRYILRMKMLCSENISDTLVCLFWLFNPFTITISSRGNAESVQIFLVLLTLLFVMRDEIYIGAFCFGFSVHFKLYPVIYVVPILLHISSKKCNTNLRRDNIFNFSKDMLRFIVNTQTISFSVVSLATFCSIGVVMFFRHGFEFIENTYLFHMRRKDFEHNFSPYFYVLRIMQDTPWLDIVNCSVFVPQLLAVSWLGVRFYHKLPLACFLQTFAFVSLNKVCTSQYFIWYIGLLPLAYPHMQIQMKKGVTMLVAWLVSQAIWLFPAYLLEFRKMNVVLYVWAASIFFLMTNICLMYHFTKTSAAVDEYDDKHGVKKRKPIKSH